MMSYVTMYYAKRQAHDWDWQVSLQMYYCYIYISAPLLTMYYALHNILIWQFQQSKTCVNSDSWGAYAIWMTGENVVDIRNVVTYKTTRWDRGTISTIKCWTKTNCKLDCEWYHEHNQMPNEANCDTQFAIWIRSTASGTTSTVSQSHVWGGGSLDVCEFVAGKQDRGFCVFDKYIVVTYITIRFRTKRRL